MFIVIGNQNNPNYIINQQFQNYNLQNLPYSNNPNQFFNKQNLLLNNNLYNNLNYMDNINNKFWLLKNWFGLFVCGKFCKL